MFRKSGEALWKGCVHERLAEYSWKPHRVSFCSKKPTTGLNSLLYALKSEKYGFIEFEISNSTVSTVFGQPLRALST